MKDYQERAFSVVAKYDSHEDLFWRADFTLIGVMCSDFFYYATADFEEIKSDEDANALEQAYKDVIEVTGDSYYVIWGACLYAARKRKLPPGTFIKFKNEKIKALFDEAVV